jgi:hypothetical protein
MLLDRLPNALAVFDQAFWRVNAALVLPGLSVPPLRRLTFGKRPKSKQKVLPLASGPTPSGSLSPSLLQGPAYKGRPWPFTPLAASMRLAPFHNDSTRPPDGAFVLARTDWFGGAASWLLICKMGGAQRYPSINSMCIAHPTNVRRTCRSGLPAMLWFLRSALPSTNPPDNAVPEFRQEAEWRCCGEGRLAWMPNEERWARDGPP